MPLEVDTVQQPWSSSTKPAPGELELVRVFVNTIDVETGEEKFDSAENLRSWLVERRLLGAKEQATAGDLRKTVELRLALREMLAHNNGYPLEPDALPNLERAASRAKLTPRFQADAPPSLEPAAAGVDGALGRIIGIVFRAQSEGTWQRLKVCREHTCAWAFYDSSKNRSGMWCTMKVCGNREKVRAYRRRARSGARSSS